MAFFASAKLIHQDFAKGAPIQVVERNGRRELHFGNHVIQSAFRLDDPDSLELEYTRAMMAVFLLHPQPRRVLSIGLGGGSMQRFIHQHFPDVWQRVVEVSPQVVQTARTYFMLPDTCRLEVALEDGEAFLKGNSDPWDLILMDAFTAEGTPNNLETESSFLAAAGRLAPGGWLAANLWGSESHNVKRQIQMRQRRFRYVYTLRVGLGSNILLFSGDSPPPPAQEMAQAAGRLRQRTRLGFPAFLGRLVRVEPLGR